MKSGVLQAIRAYALSPGRNRGSFHTSLLNGPRPGKRVPCRLSVPDCLPSDGNQPAARSEE